MKKKVFLILFMLSLNNIYSQIISGEVTFKVIMSVDSNDDIYKKSAQKGANKLEFILEFDRSSSLFKQIDKIENEEMPVIMATALSGYSNPIAYSKKDNVFIYNNIVSPLTDEQEFLIEFKDSIGWTLTNESKTINNYVCYKATSQRPIYKYDKVSYFEVLAWYCPKIALPYGPLNSAGLPGLIFEFQNQRASFVIDKIKLDKEVNIKPPNKGKLVSEKKFYKIFNDRINEASESLKEKK